MHLKSDQFRLGRLALLGWLCVLPGSLLAQEKIPAKHLEFFEKKIRPVLVKHCYSCHSKDAKSVKGGLVLDTREGIRAGGDSGHAVVPGELESSLLMESIRYESFEMPPSGQLPENVIADFQRWVEMGAPDPREGPSLIKREINFEEAKHHWAFQPISDPAVPDIGNASWPRSDVDRFVYSKLNDKGLKPVGDADRQTLVRRLYFDLIGLPPTPDQLNAAMSDDSPEAIEKLVDELLESPHFGERWGRHWLDVVRYAESNGRERNFVYPHAWRFRDYVIDSFNADKRFDRFIVEQIAGDLLEEPGDEQLIATGFLAIGPKLLNEGNKNEFQMDMVDEQIDVTTRAFMSLTVSCARCHDHKFDPIPTSEYYSVAGIFRSTSTLYGTKRQQGNRQASELVPLQSDPSEMAELDQKKQEHLAELKSKMDAAKKKMASLQAQAKNRNANRKNPKAKKLTPSQLADNRRTITNLRRRVQALQQEMKDVEKNGVGEKAMGVREGKVTNSPIYVRGEVSSPKGSAPRGFLTILDPDLEQPILETSQSGRMELANWIASEQNSLTTRVVVNRIWHHLFGNGIVRTVDNFGATGEPPTHPELLDFLANRFSQNGWSMKKMIRELVLSRTYQLSADFADANYETDPDNFLLWRHTPQRIDAESVRDAILLASGNLEMDPPLGSVVSSLKGEYGRQVSISKLAKDNEFRSVYLPIIRNDLPEALKLFDFAEPSMLVGERPVTTVPTQALYFMNSDFVTNQSDAMAANLLNEDLSSDAERVVSAYRSVLSRDPDGSEVERAVSFIKSSEQQLVDKLKGDKASATKFAWSSFCQALFGSAEFRYVE